MIHRMTSHPAEEPRALAKHAGIFAGGEETSSSLPRPCDHRRLDRQVSLRAALRLSLGWGSLPRRDNLYPPSAKIRLAKFCTSPLDPLRSVTSTQLSSSRWTCP